MNDMERLREAMHRELDGMQPPASDQKVLNRARRRRTSRVAWVSLLSVVVLAGIILPLKALAPLTDRDKSSRVVPGLQGSTAVTPPEGRIAFALERSDKSDVVIATANPDGSDWRDLVVQGQLMTNEPGIAGMDWSPDGRWLAFSADWPDNHIYLVRADGSDLHMLLPEHVANLNSPTWSPDGSQIAMDRNDTIYVVNADGSGGRTIETGLDWMGGPDWSPDGESFVFTSSPHPDPFAGTDMEGSQDDIYTIRADGSGLTDLTAGRLVMAAAPKWSPDGRRIVFQGNPGTDLEGSNQRIFTMNPDGTGIVQVGDADTFGQQPSWSPDGAYIAYSCANPSEDRSMQVCLMNADGSSITTLDVETTQPVWGPRVAVPADVSPEPPQVSSPPALAAQLGLVPQDQPDEACDIWVVPPFSAPKGFCLDGHYSTYAEAWVLYENLRGRYPTPEETAQWAAFHSTEDSRDQLPSGRQIGEAFGFPTGRSYRDFPGGCRDFAEYEYGDGRGFCMESFSGSDKALSLLGHALTGQPMNAEEVRIVQEMIDLQQMVAADGVSATSRELADQIAQEAATWWEYKLGRSAEDFYPRHGSWDVAPTPTPSPSR